MNLSNLPGVFIPKNVPSSKNSKRILTKPYPRLIHSELTMKYIKSTKGYWLQEKTPFLNLIKDEAPPLVVGFHFIRSTRRAYDWINAVQIIQDLMNKYNWIPDDDVSNLIPMPFKLDDQYSTVDKEHPGVLIVPFTTKLKLDKSL